MDTTLLRQTNRNAVLRVVRQHPTVSRARIAAETGLSRASITGIIREWLKRQLIEEVGEGGSTGGRPPELLRFNSNAFQTIAVDLAAGLIAVTDLSANIKAELELKLDRHQPPQITLEHTAATIRSILGGLGIDRSSVLGIGVAVPGIVDRDKGTVILSGELAWRDVPIKSFLEQAAGIPVFVDNHVRIRTIGEHLFGTAKGSRSLGCAHFDHSGIGAAAILNGRVVCGEHYAISEIGHLAIVRDGPPCSCGNRGCLQKLTTGESILARITNAIRAGRDTQILELANGRPESITLAHLFQAAAMGDTLAVQVTVDLVHYLGLAVSILINILDPRMVVLSGSVIDVGGNSLLDAIREDAMNKILPSINRQVQIERTTLGTQAGIIGACALVGEECLALS